MVRLTRVYRFCASHRLHSDLLTEEENQEVYGKCNHPHGHGHNYRLEVTIAGPVDDKTGKAVDVVKLDRLIGESVLRPFDHHDLNREVPEFAKLVPTSENLALVIEQRLHRDWQLFFSGTGAGATARLDNVRLHETPRNRFDLRP
jgi:6-pyruvoyltetrahydropterin/6-carboxytetrahydropterin synthase